MVRYSHSKLSTFEQCNLKYKMKYIDKIKPELGPTIEAVLGKAVHETFEWLYHRVINKQTTPTLDETIEYFSERWEKNCEQEVRVVKNGLTKEHYYDKGIQFIITYYTKHAPFDDNTLELEKEIFIDLDNEGAYKLWGFIDRLTFNKQKNEYEVHDYKTANSLPPKEKVDSDRQLGIYALAIKELYGEDKEVNLIWHYLAHNMKITSRRTNEELKKLKQDIMNLIHQIEAADHFPPTKTILCDWCEYKSMCPAWNNLPIEKQERLF